MALINRIIKKIDRNKGMVNRYLNILHREYTTDLQPSFNISDSQKKLEEKYSIIQNILLYVLMQNMVQLKNGQHRIG
jgi:hypothetical protein